MTRSNDPLPVLSDDRVVLRALEPRDLPAIEAGIHDPDVIRWIGPPEGIARDALIQAEERWAQGSPTLAICEPDGTFAGKAWVGFRDGDTSTGYVGYWLLPAARGRGLATSAVRLLSSWAARELPLARVRLTTEPENVRSQRVAERSGFRRVSDEIDDRSDRATAGQVVYELQGDRS